MFDYLNKILYKSRTVDTENIAEDSEFQPFMIQRWCSMYSPQINTLLNQTSNRVWPILNDKTAWFQYLHTIVPRCTFKRISYIKKKKEASSHAEKKETIQKLAERLEISSREVSQYVELYNLQIPNEKKSTS